MVWYFVEEGDFMYCQKCGSEIPAGEARCPCCGALRDGLKFCQHCGDAIDKECIVCPKCGKQVSDLKGTQPQVVINNANNNTNVNRNTAYSYSRRPGAEKNKWVAFFLCLFLGVFGAHKFYEGKIGMGIVYLFTVGLFGIGLIIDFISILLKPTIYFV